MITAYKKRNTIFRVLILLLSGLLLFLPLFVFAQETYVPLTEGGIPGINEGTSFSGFLDAIFKLGLAAAATLAVVMITIGGFEYMGSESVFAKTAGRERIQNAVIGLIIALLIWLILFTINPNLLNFDLTINNQKVDISAPDVKPTIKKKGGGTLKIGDKTFIFGGSDGEIQPAPIDQFPGEDQIIEEQIEEESQQISDETDVPS